MIEILKGLPWVMYFLTQQVCRIFQQKDLFAGCLQDDVRTITISFHFYASFCRCYKFGMIHGRSSFTALPARISCRFSRPLSQTMLNGSDGRHCMRNYSARRLWNTDQSTSGTKHLLTYLSTLHLIDFKIERKILHFPIYARNSKNSMNEKCFM